MHGSALRRVAWNLSVAGRPVEGRRLRAAADRGEAPSPAPAWIEAATAEIERARRIDAAIVTPDDDVWPALLRQAANPPSVLYVRGDLRAEDILAVAVVGARRATPQGAALARALGRDLAAAGFTVVSGLARGIDAAAHRGALEAGGRTIAVLGSGVDRIYPEEHRDLALAIVRQGAVASEFPIGTAPLARNFPERNRIIAALSWATVVVEAAEGSGSLITAGLALDAGRLVFAVPGPVDEPNAVGTNALLHEGAILCRSARDVLDDLAPQIVEAARLRIGGGAGSWAGAAPAGAENVRAGRGADQAARGSGLTGRDADQYDALPPDARRVLEALPATRGIDVDRLAARAELGSGPLAAALLELELRGLVKPLPGGRFLRVRGAVGGGDGAVEGLADEAAGGTGNTADDVSGEAAADPQLEKNTGSLYFASPAADSRTPED
jgi:DNA processing protein